ncbi:hypothetical protein PROFUN_03166 [Planoprotostelium fungivorum]|uniref:Uncharacterized protein n=1 Tax=Planoprotostelium fungivorum TaxID=1890364 RepID=A0A2P6NWX2_9EUKA|nr:hypothetical protein PROFUN_03166 [Planoprotostelium fungivorum]
MKRASLLDDCQNLDAVNPLRGRDWKQDCVKQLSEHCSSPRPRGSRSAQGNVIPETTITIHMLRPRVIRPINPRSIVSEPNKSKGLIHTTWRQDSEGTFLGAIERDIERVDQEPSRITGGDVSKCRILLRDRLKLPRDIVNYIMLLGAYEYTQVWNSPIPPGTASLSGSESEPVIDFRVPSLPPHICIKQIEIVCFSHDQGWADESYLYGGTFQASWNYEGKDVQVFHQAICNLCADSTTQRHQMVIDMDEAWPLTKSIGNNTRILLRPRTREQAWAFHFEKAQLKITYQFNKSLL